jgi:hypothetical protein
MFQQLLNLLCGGIEAREGLTGQHPLTFRDGTPGFDGVGGFAVDLFGLVAFGEVADDLAMRGSTFEAVEVLGGGCGCVCVLCVRVCVCV